MPISATPVTVGREEDDGDAADAERRRSFARLSGRLGGVAGRRGQRGKSPRDPPRTGFLEHAGSLAHQLSGAPQMSHAQSLSLSATGI